MKFSCERCGKRYATAEPPAPGKVYRMRCKACGHVIIVRGGEAGPGAGPAADAGAQVRAAKPAPDGSAGPPAASAPPGEASPAEGGYVDLFADLDATAEVRAVTAGDAISDLVLADEPARDAGAGAAPGLPPEAQALLDAGPGQATAVPGLPPAAPLRAEATRPVPSIPPVPRPARQGGPPFALIGVGVAVLLGILVFVLWGPGTRAPPPPVAVKAQAQQPRPPAAPPPAVAPRPAPPAPVEAPPPAPAAAAAVPVPAGPEPSARDRERHPRPERPAPPRRVAQASPAPRPAERPPAKVAAPPAPVPAPPEPEPAEEEVAPAALTEEQVGAVVRASQKAFDACLERARVEGRPDGRRVLLRLSVRSTGVVAYATLDDVTFNDTEAGACLKRTARGMLFPPFKGDPRSVEVPLVVP